MSMFTIPHHPYIYDEPPLLPRYNSTHDIISTFSSSAHPDEDWTKVSNMAERRRIQNRIAQRKYRSKLKLRLEDLERRAGSSDNGSTRKKPRSTCTSKPKRQSTFKTPEPCPPVPVANLIAITQGLLPYTLENNRDKAFGPVFESLEHSHMPPKFGHTKYSALNELLTGPYASTQLYPPTSAADPYPDSLTLVNT